MKYKIICDYCENFAAKADLGHINDHQTKETFFVIEEAIRRKGYDCEIFGGVPELIEAYYDKKTFPNTIFINLSDGTDKRYSRVQIPILCDLLDLNYSGSGTFETALTTNKYYASLAVKDHHFLAPENFLISKSSDLKYILDNQLYIVKPNNEGSSLGISEQSVSANKAFVIKQANNLLKDFPEVLVEEYIAGYDVTCFVIGNKKILLNEPLVIKHHGKTFFDKEVMGYAEHAQKTRSFVSCEPYLSASTIDRVREMSIRIKNLFHVYDFCRIDYRITANDQIYFLEINTVPAISPDSQAGVICKNLHISFDEFMEQILLTTKNRFNHV